MMKNKYVRKILAIFLLWIIVVGINGCAQKIHPPPAKHREPVVKKAPEPVDQDLERLPATQRQYTVLGQTYTPLSCHKGFAEEGIASWYGPKFHGLRTSSGEIYNMYEMTAAHRLLPMNTKIRVTNLDNGKVIELRVNDRGPFSKDRIVDLSFAAAREIEMIGPGTAKVRVEAIGSVPKSQLVGDFYIQVGSFSSRENAVRLMEEMKKNGYPETRLQEFSRNSQRLWRVQAGSFSNLLAAENAHSKLLEEIPGAFIIAD